MAIASSLSLMFESSAASDDDEESLSDVVYNYLRSGGASTKEIVVNLSLTLTVNSRSKRSVQERYNVTMFRTANLNASGTSDELSNVTSKSLLTQTYYECPHPEYIVFTWVLCLIALATALKLYYLIKLFLAIAMISVYTILIMIPYNIVFSDNYIVDE